MAEYRILIVDDRRDTRRRLRLQLETLGPGFQVAEVSSGEEALLVLSRQSFHLLIANQRLAGLSRLELLPKARQRQPALQAILVLTAADRKLEEKIAPAEWVRLVYKPDQAGQLAGAVSQLLNLEGAGAEPRPEASLAERLGSLRRELDALMVTLLDDRGQIIAQAGNGKQASSLAVLIPALMATYSAAEKVSLALGADPPENVLFFSGAEYDLTLAHVGRLAALLIVSAPAVRAEMGAKLISALRPAINDLLQILADMGLLPPQMPEQLGEQSAPEEQVEAEANLGELETALQQAGEQELDAADVDQFWDSLVEGDTGKKPPGTGELSYEQAQQIGLTPEEET